jgi:cytochrome P450
MSMNVASPVNIPVSPNPKALRHIPGNEGWPFIGNTLAVLADPKGQIEKSAAKYGLVYRTHLFGETSVTMLGPDANELVLFDQGRLFSSTHGWGPILGLLFPRGLMLLDFEEHRLHRRALSVAFKSGPMKSYLVDLDRGIAARVKQWKTQPGEMLVYPAMKQLTLDLAATSFLGAEIGPRRRDHPRLRRHGGSRGADPRPLPFTQRAAALQACGSLPLRRADGSAARRRQ